MMRLEFANNKSEREEKAIMITRKFMNIMNSHGGADEIYRTMQDFADLYTEARLAGF